MSSRQSLAALIPSLSDKFRSSDSDLRVMALIDLNKELARILEVNANKPGAFYVEEASEKVLTTMVLHLLTDSNAEVKAAAVACLANMSRRARPKYLNIIVNEIVKGIGAPGEKVDEEARDISCLALKAVVTEMSPDASDVATSLKTIFARIRQNVCVANANAQLASELLQILAEVYPRFDNTIVASKDLQAASLSMLREALTIPRLSVRKRAVPALAALVAVCPSLFDSLKDDIASGFAAGGDSAKAWVAAVAGIAKTSAHAGVGALISSGDLVDNILAQTDDLDDTDAVEGAVTALEVLAFRCAADFAPYVPKVTERALVLIKYDPNYVEDDEDDDVDMEGEDEDDDDDYDDAYSDDEDDSWKIRRSSAKLLHALISTRIELLAEFYKTAAVPLMSRFSEREESVRLEVLSAFEALLKQTSNARDAESAAGGRNKRKRNDDDMDADPDNRAISTLLEMSPRLVKAILKQAGAKSVTTRQQSFILLRHVVEALGGGLEATADAICAAAALALRHSDSTTPSLTIAVLSFLTAFFTYHSARSYASHLAGLTGDVISSMRDKLQRVNFEAFACASAIASALRTKGSSSPLGYNRPIQDIFAATCSVLGDTSVDGEVREKALITLGDVLVNEGDVILSQHSDALGLITARLASETTASTAVEVIGRVADAPLCSSPAVDAWLLNVLPEVVVSIRRNKRSASKTTEFNAINSIVRRLGATLPEDTASTIVVELKQFVKSPSALETLSIVLQAQPASRHAINEHIMAEVFELIKQSNGSQVIKALAGFFGVYVANEEDSALRLVPSLVNNLGKATALPDATHGGTAPYTTTARCIGAVMFNSQRNLAGILSTFQHDIQSGKAPEPTVYLALLCIGEIGRLDNLSVNADLFQQVLAFLDHGNDEVSSAAAFAAGNMVVGAPEELLPVLIRRLESAKSDSAHLLLLHALKEVIMHSSDPLLDKLTDLLWRPLFSMDASADDGVRNVKAACIGKLTIASPGRFLPQLQSMLRGSVQERALVAAAIRYAFIDSDKDYAARTDELLAPIVGEFLALMNDENHVIRRLAVAALNAAAQNRPYLIADKLSTLQQYLYKETEIKKELQREVPMGPFKVLEDDGLENRKTAYETMYTLLATCLSKLELPTFAERVIGGLKDVNEVKTLALMLLLRLAHVAPAHVTPRLDDIVPTLEDMMKNLDIKDDMIKKEIERKEEIQRGTLRTIVPLYRMTTAAQAPAFHAFAGNLLKSDQWKEYGSYQA